MDSLISRQAAIDALGERPMVWTDDDQYALGERNQYDIDRLAIGTLPSAEMVGKWIGSDDFDEYYRCSECGKGETQFGRLYRYCPWCGARMRGDEDET